MQTQRYSALIEKAIKAALALKPNEALFLPNSLIAAKSSTGKLRLGSGWQWPRWFRTVDPEADLRECLTGALDWKTAGYFAGQYARELDLGLCLRPVRVTGVGRTTFQRDQVVRRGI